MTGSRGACCSLVHRDPRTALATALAGALDAAIPAAAGIAGVTVGQTEAEVRGARGAPVRVLRGPSAFGQRRDLVSQFLTVRFPGRKGGGAVAVSTGVRRQLTARASAWDRPRSR